jgi:hypothetical protein
MTRAQLRKKAIAAIDTRGCLLVYPVNNKPEPRSVWSEVFPRSKMRWEWDSDGDNRVADLWYLKEELSRSREVVYAKWFQGRATLFSFEVFTNMIAFTGAPALAEGLHGPSRDALEYLQNDSPLSTKQLKAALELEGRLNESTYNRALKPLWQTGAIVAFGEFEDSSFPSLGIGATSTLFEDLWSEAAGLDRDKSGEFLLKKLGETNPFYKFALKIKKSYA